MSSPLGNDTFNNGYNVPPVLVTRVRDFTCIEAVMVAGATCTLTVFLRLVCVAFQDSKFPRLPLCFFSVSTGCSLAFTALVIRYHYQGITDFAQDRSTLLGTTWGLGFIAPMLCNCANLSRIMMFYPRTDPVKFRRGLLVLIPSILFKLAWLGCVINLCVFLAKFQNKGKSPTRTSQNKLMQGAKPLIWLLAMSDALYCSGLLSYKLWKAGWSNDAKASRNGLGARLVGILRGAFFVSVSAMVLPTILCITNVIWFFWLRGGFDMGREILIIVWMWTDQVCQQYAFLWPTRQTATLRSAVRARPTRVSFLDHPDDDAFGGMRHSNLEKGVPRSRCPVKRPCAVRRPPIEDEAVADEATPAAKGTDAQDDELCLTSVAVGQIDDKGDSGEKIGPATLNGQCVGASLPLDIVNSKDKVDYHIWPARRPRRFRDRREAIRRSTNVY